MYRLVRERGRHPWLHLRASRSGKIATVVTTGVSLPILNRRYQRLLILLVVKVAGTLVPARTRDIIKRGLKPTLRTEKPANFPGSEVLSPTFCYLAIRLRWLASIADTLTTRPESLP